MGKSRKVIKNNRTKKRGRRINNIKKGGTSGTRKHRIPQFLYLFILICVSIIPVVKSDVLINYNKDSDNLQLTFDGPSDFLTKGKQYSVEVTKDPIFGQNEVFAKINETLNSDSVTPIEIKEILKDSFDELCMVISMVGFLPEGYNPNECYSDYKSLECNKQQLQEKEKGKKAFLSRVTYETVLSAFEKFKAILKENRHKIQSENDAEELKQKKKDFETQKQIKDLADKLVEKKTQLLKKETDEAKQKIALLEKELSKTDEEKIADALSKMNREDATIVGSLLIFVAYGSLFSIIFIGAVLAYIRLKLGPINDDKIREILIDYFGILKIPFLNEKKLLKKIKKLGEDYNEFMGYLEQFQNSVDKNVKEQEIPILMEKITLIRVTLNFIIQFSLFKQCKIEASKILYP
jgi:hypothetical protein